MPSFLHTTSPFWTTVLFLFYHPYRLLPAFAFHHHHHHHPPTSSSSSTSSSSRASESKPQHHTPCEEPNNNSPISAFLHSVPPNILPSDDVTSYSSISSFPSGFCNQVYRIVYPPTTTTTTTAPIPSSSSSTSLVLKLYSPMAKLRLSHLQHPSLRGHIDELASSLSIGPKLLFRSPDGILCECLDDEGETLSESTVCSEEEEGRDVCREVGRMVALLHRTPLELLQQQQPSSHPQSNMLWGTLGRMVARIGMKEEEDEGGKREKLGGYLEGEIRRMREVVRPLGLGMVMGHGDLKPSNVMVTSSSLSSSSSLDGGGGRMTVRLIDFELGGPNYRGYDICKFFRTTTDQAAVPSGIGTEENKRIFGRAYLGFDDDDDDDDNDNDNDEATPKTTKKKKNDHNDEEEKEQKLNQLLAESNIFLPLTWLEAGTFFCFAAKEDPENADRWMELAEDRLAQYELVREGMDLDVGRYREICGVLL